MASSSSDLENNPNENGVSLSDELQTIRINHSNPTPFSGSQPPIRPPPLTVSRDSRPGGPVTNRVSTTVQGPPWGGSPPPLLNVPSGRPTVPPPLYRSIPPPSNVAPTRPLGPHIDPLTWGPQGSLSLPIPQQPPFSVTRAERPSLSTTTTSPPRSHWWKKGPQQMVEALKGTILTPRNGRIPPSLLDQSKTVAGDPLAELSNNESDQIPHPQPSSYIVMYETLQRNRVNYPPSATSDYIVKDTGNCSPRYMRCTMNQIPCSGDLLAQSNMPLALILQPLALPHQYEEPIHVVDFGGNGPVRCCHCKGYINPFMKFIDQGKHFICNLCGFINETPPDYYCNLGPDGRRLDTDERPELCRGTVEFLVSNEYMVRDPMPAVYFFLIDVSKNAIQSGGTAAACSAVGQVIADLPEGTRTMVGLATYDSSVQFYNLKRPLQQPLMFIIPDTEDVYSPLHTDIVVNLSKCRQQLEQLLEDIPVMFQNSKISDSAFGAAIMAAFLSMKATGGKLLVFQSVLPSVGIGALSAREAEKVILACAGEKEMLKLLQPADSSLNEMALVLAENQVCVDVFITAQNYVDVASVSCIPRTTGGQIYYYYPFSALLDSAKLYNDLRWNVTRPQGFEAAMRLRCSQGIDIQEYLGNFCRSLPTDIDLPGIDCDKAILVTLKHHDKLQEGSECAFQSALLYTTISGQRMVRVSTLSLPCTNTLRALFLSADLDVQLTCFLKQAANEIPSSPLLQVREKILNRCINVLLSYRKFCAMVSLSLRFIFPESLKLLPLYCLALIKSTGLRTDGWIDDRSYWINRVSSLSTQLAVPLVYPRMMAIHTLVSEEDDGYLATPTIPLSIEHLTQDGIFLLENGEDAMIFVGNQVNSDLLQQLFGIALEDIANQFVLQQYDNPLSIKLNDLVNGIRRLRCSYLRLRLCKNGEPSGRQFLSYMVEDKNGSFSYIDFLNHIHRRIQVDLP